jgi:hypothetical protein
MSKEPDPKKNLFKQISKAGWKDFKARNKEVVVSDKYTG